MDPEIWYDCTARKYILFGSGGSIKMKRNILLTTMSTIQARASINYYYDEKANVYFSGVASVEPGAKYFLSRENLGIDRMIVLGSNQTYRSDDVLSTDDLSAEYQSLRNSSPKEMSDFTFFKYRIGQFLAGDMIEENRVGESIEETRRQEIRRIVEDTLNSKGHTDRRTWFAEINQNNAKMHYDAVIRNALKEDIEKNFVKPEDYNRYVDPATFPEISDVQNEQKLVTALDEQLNEIEKKIHEAKNNSIRDESFLSSALQHLEDARAEIHEKKLDSSEAVNAEIMNRISRTIQNLISEIRSLKEKRLDQENIYAKQYIFSCLDDSRKGVFPKTSRHLSVLFIPERTARDTDNIVEIINGIRGNGDDQIMLYIDMQGGGRTDSYVRNAILSVLNNESSQNGSQKVIVRTVVASNFERRNFANRIVDETSRYKITDLISGMNAFIRYGKADLIQQYVQETGISNTRVIDLVNEMVNIDHALSICDIDRFTDSVKKLQKLFHADETQDDSGAEVFEALEDGIQKDYAVFFQSNDINYVDLAQWALNKNFIQQALTILESKMPEEFVRQGVLYYCSKTDNKDVITGKFREIKDKLPKKEKYKIENIDHYFIKTYEKDYSADQKNRNPIGIPVIEEKTDFSDEAVNQILKNYDYICWKRNQLNHANIDERNFIRKGKKKSQGNCSPGELIYQGLREDMQNFIDDYKKAIGNAPYSSNVVRITYAELLSNTPKGPAKESSKPKNAPKRVNDLQPLELKLGPIDDNSQIEAWIIAPVMNNTQGKNNVSKSIERNYGGRLKAGFPADISNYFVLNTLFTTKNQQFIASTGDHLIMLAINDIEQFLKQDGNRLVFIDSRLMDLQNGMLRKLTEGVSSRVISVQAEKDYQILH